MKKKVDVESLASARNMSGYMHVYTQTHNTTHTCLGPILSVDLLLLENEISTSFLILAISAVVFVAC